MRIVWSFKVDGTGGCPPRPLPGAAGEAAEPLCGVPDCGGCACGGRAGRAGPPSAPNTVLVKPKGWAVAHVVTQCSVAVLLFCACTNVSNARNTIEMNPNVL